MKNDIAYNNLDFIPDGASYPDRWAEEARAWREREAAVGRARLNHAYGPAERQKMDVFHPSGPAEGLIVFVHGGYWLRFHRDFWSHFAEGLTTRAGRWRCRPTLWRPRHGFPRSPARQYAPWRAQQHWCRDRYA